MASRSASTAQSKPSGIDIVQLARDIARQWPIVLLTVVAVMAASLEAKKLIKPYYVSATTILIDPKRPGVIGADGQFTNPYADNTKVSSIVSIIESTGLLSRVVRDEHLADDPDFGDPVPSFLTKFIPARFLPAPAPETNTAEIREARALDRLSRSVGATRLGMTYVIKIEAKAPTAANARRLATAVATAYLEDQVINKHEATRRDSAWLSGRLAELRAELLRNEEAVEAIREKFGLTETDRGPSATTGRQIITDLNAQLTVAEGEVATRRAKYEQVERLRKSKGNMDTLPEVVASLAIADLHRARTEVARKIADMAARYMPNYPDLVQAERDKRALEGQISAEVMRIADGLRNDYEVAVTKRDGLKALLAHEVASSSSIASSQGRIQLREAQRAADTTRAFYEGQLHRLREVEQQETREEVEARVLSPANLPPSPKFPTTPIVLAGGGALGLLLGFCFAAARPLLGNRFVTEEWAEHSLGLPLLGSVPRMRPRDLGPRGERLSLIEYLKSKPLSRFAECLRAIRARLKVFRTVTPKVIQVTSAVPGEGKSTMAAMLAISAAAAGMKTILVDLDIRNASVANLFGMQEGEGVADVLQGRAMIGSAMQTYEKLPLMVVGTGSLARMQPDVINSPDFASLVQDLSERFDMVILDSPPVLAVSDSILISNAVDATLLVVKAYGTPRGLVKEAVKALKVGNAPLAGVVLNQVDFSRSRGYEGKYYKDYYSSTSKYVSN